MTVEEAITMALELERKVQGVYLAAVDRSQFDTGKRFFHVLADEEGAHVSYLEGKLEEWKKTGAVVADVLRTAVPPADVIDRHARKLTTTLAPSERQHLGQELNLLEAALAAEKETSSFYRRLVATLPQRDRGLFERFMEIETGHVAIVQAEIDILTRTGYWFDFPEFDLETE